MEGASHVGRGLAGGSLWTVDSPHQDCASVRGVLGHQEVQLVGLS